MRENRSFSHERNSTKRGAKTTKNRLKFGIFHTQESANLVQ